MKRIEQSWVRWLAAALAVAGAGVMLLRLSQVERPVFFRAYLFAYLVVLGLALGSVCLMLLHNLTGGEWGDTVRPVLHAMSLTLPLMVILFIPIACQLAALFPWARAGITDPVVLHRQPYLNAPFFLIRAAMYFAVWLFLAFRLHRGGLSQGLSAAGLILYLFTMTHAGYDWIMSRDANFHSTTFGFIVTVGQTLGALAFAIVLGTSRKAAPSTPRAPARGALLLNDLGNVLLTIVILWIYVAFMQFLVIWMGNLRDDNHWYLQRGVGDPGVAPLAWGIIGLSLVAFHFFVPFFLLLFRSAKQYRPMLFAIAALLLLSFITEQYWYIAPTDHAAPRFDPTVLDAGALMGMGGLWFLIFLLIRPRIAAPPAAPDAFEEALAHG